MKFTSDDKILQKTRIHQLARDIVNDTVTGELSLETSERIAEIALPSLKQQWVRDQIHGIQKSGE